MPKVSVAMTTYNGEKYILKQLQSLYGQSYPIDEVIICDDSSSDATAALVEAFLKEKQLFHWHFSVNKKNLGFKANFRQAIAGTTGDYIFLCDQDDIWESDKIEAMLAEMIKNPKIKALNCSFIFIDSDDRVKPLVNRRGYCNGDSLPLTVADGAVVNIPFSLIAGRNFFPGCTMVMTRDLKELYLKETRETLVHDWYLNFLAALVFDGLYFYHCPLIRYRLHEENTIGMDVVLEKTLTVRGDRQKRLAEVSNDEATVTEFLAVAQKYGADRGSKIFYLQSYLRFFAAKKQALMKKSLFGILGLYRQAAIYRQYQSFRSRLLDIYTVVKRG